MFVGVDIGTGNIVCAKEGEGEEGVSLSSFRDVFLALDNHNAMIVRNFDKNGTPYVVIDGTLYLLGEVAQDKALMYSKEVRRPLAKGVINGKEKVAQKILQNILERLVGKAEQEGSKLVFSIPANPIDAANINTIYHESIFSEIFKNMGYEVDSLNEGMAVVYSELLDKDLTGIGISMGAGMCNIAIALDGMPIQCNINGSTCDGFSVARSGDWVDQEVFNVFESQGHSKAFIVSTKESPDLDLLAPKNELEKALQFYYKNLCKYLANKIADYMRSADEVPTFHSPLNVAVAGGTSMPKGVGVILMEELRKVDLPFDLKELIMASDPLNATAIGCFLAANN